MAATVSLRAYLRGVIGLGNDAEGLERADAIIAEGINAAEDLADLYDNKGVKILCSNVRKPGGTIPDPTHVGAGAAPRIPQPGKSIPTICENRLNLAAYGSKLYSSINRDVDTINLNRARLRHFKQHMDMVENHEEPEQLAPISKSFTVIKFLDQLPTYIRELHGVAKVSLAYLIREDIIPTLPLPPLQPNLPWSEDMDSMMDELIAFTPHSGPNFDADNARLFGILQKALSGTASMASITRYQRRRNGRDAFKALVTHNLGTNKWEDLVENAEIMLNQRKWNGRNARYPLKIHIARHREAHNDMVRAAEHIPYSPPNGTTRVRHLMNSIESNDPIICSCKTTIQADALKKHDFELAADFILSQIPKNKSLPIHKISGLKYKGKGNGKGKVKVGPKTGVELRYYKRNEWMQLSQEQRDECVEIRRKSREKRKHPEKENDYPAKIAALESKIQQQQVQILALQSEPPQQAEEDTNESLPPPPAKNPLQPPPGFTQRTKRK